MEWAALYDMAGVEVRSKVLEEWMSELQCPIVRIEGDLTVKERVEIVQNYIKSSESGG